MNRLRHCVCILYNPRNVSTLQNISCLPCVLCFKELDGCYHVSLSLVCAQIRSHVPKFGTELFNMNRYSVSIQSVPNSTFDNFLKGFLTPRLNCFLQFSCCGPWRAFSHSTSPPHHALGRYGHTYSSRKFCNFLC